jgi:hypothetical protein
MLSSFLSSMIMADNVVVTLSEDDGTFCVRQHVCTSQDKTLHFGPLQTTLGQLFLDGWFLQCHGRVIDRSVKMSLQHTTKMDRYKVRKVNCYHSAVSLCDLVPDDMQYIQKYCSKDTDPMLALMLKFPVKKTVKPTLIGNSTLGEYLYPMN